MATKEKPFRFIYVSGEGADQTEKARALFGRIKGRTEKELNEMDSEEFQVLSIRPGGIIPTDEVGFNGHFRGLRNLISSSIDPGWVH